MPHLGRFNYLEAPTQIIIDAYAHVLSDDFMGKLASKEPFSNERMDDNYTYFVPATPRLVHLSIALKNASPRTAAEPKVQTYSNIKVKRRVVLVHHPSNTAVTRMAVLEES